MSRVVRALGAASVGWLIPLTLGLYGLSSGPGSDASGEPDNERHRDPVC